MRRVVAMMIVAALAVPGAAAAQVPSDVWRGVAESIDPGTEVHVQLRDGKRFRAVLVGARQDVVLLQPKTRVAVPVQPVPYGEIASLERRQGGGIGGGKAAAIGVASGVGAFFAMLLILIATLD